MFENKTFNSIINDMLNSVSDDMDKREGSLIYNAIAPAALILAQLYIDLDLVLIETFADTASRDYLIKRIFERGLSPLPATKSVLCGVFNMEIPIQSRFSIEDLNFIAKEKTTDFEYKMECESEGSVGNSLLGRLIPIDYIQGLTTAQLTEILVPGEDEEDTESIRKRYIDSLEAEAFGGNKEDYKQRTNALDGVGGVKVHPVWDGGGTVKLEIIDSNYNEPNTSLVEEVQDAIDPWDNQGEGLGIAPIGHVVTVEGVFEETIDIEFDIVYEEGWDFESAITYIEQAIDDYFLELKKSWQDSDTLIIRTSQIDTRILDITGIVDIDNTRINDSSGNFEMEGIPIRGTINE
ncbi:MAG: baseplate J/gp47 family protein [Clostridiales bacterium]|nr:baseplate J/gp47 family protein [Clostridiales bacterium]